MTQALPQWVPWVDSTGRPTPPFLTYMLQHDKTAGANSSGVAALKQQTAGLTVTINNLPSPGAAQWGGITGILAEQIDLKASLDSKGNIIGQAWSGNHDFSSAHVTISDAVDPTEPTTLEQVQAMVSHSGVVPMVNGDLPPELMYFDDGNLFLLELP